MIQDFVRDLTALLISKAVKDLTAVHFD